MQSRSKSLPPGRAPPSQTCYGELVPHPSQALLPLSFTFLDALPPSPRAEQRVVSEQLKEDNLWSHGGERCGLSMPSMCRLGQEAVHEALSGEADMAKLHQSEPSTRQFPDFLLW